MPGGARRRTVENAQFLPKMQPTFFGKKSELISDLPVAAFLLENLGIFGQN